VNVRQQQDAYEFLESFLDGIPPALKSIFQGQMKETIESAGGNVVGIPP
jgi:hypothetical protein